MINFLMICRDPLIGGDLYGGFIKAVYEVGICWRMLIQIKNVDLNSMQILINNVNLDRMSIQWRITDYITVTPEMPKVVQYVIGSSIRYRTTRVIL